MLTPIEHWLSVDLSTTKGTLAIHRLKGDTLVTLRAETLPTEGNHSEQFLPALERSLAQTGLGLNNVDRFITNSGPGSFTGLRIALSTLKALAYVGNRPIEMLSGSEARALAWIKTQTLIEVDELYVLTHLTVDRFVSAHFRVNSKAELETGHETVVSELSFLGTHKQTMLLLDDRLPKEALPIEDSSRAEVFTLEAQHLGENLMRAKSRKTHSTLTDWINLTPEYFGSTRFS